MTENAFPPMSPGGEWLREGGTGEPHYVVNPDHIKRMLAEGHQIVPDPRLPDEEESEDEDDTGDDDEEEEDEEPEPEPKPKKKVKKQ